MLCDQLEEVLAAVRLRQIDKHKPVCPTKQIKQEEHNKEGHEKTKGDAKETKRIPNATTTVPTTVSKSWQSFNLDTMKVEVCGGGCVRGDEDCDKRQSYKKQFEKEELKSRTCGGTVVWECAATQNRQEKRTKYREAAG